MNAKELEAQLLVLETALHQSAVRQDPAQLLHLLAEDFFEFGVGGKIWTRQAVIDALQTESFSPRQIRDFRLTQLAQDAALVTYYGYREATAVRPEGRSLRSSIWKYRDGRWQMQFHQGTPL